MAAYGRNEPVGSSGLGLLPSCLSMLAGPGLAACELIGGYQDFEPPSEPPNAPHACDALPERKPAQGRNATLVLVKRPNDCFWIDETEVSVGQYSEWRSPEFAAWDPERCGWKPPGASNPVGDSADACRQEAMSLQESSPFSSIKPMRCVDWCDARAFCNSFPNTHLCFESNATGGFAEPTNPAEWFYACNHGDAGQPWGSEPLEPGRCNVAQEEFGCWVGALPPCGAAATGAFPGCKTPTGIADLIGNVVEWVFWCAGSTPSNSPDTRCHTFGGSFALGASSARCDRIALSLPRATRRPDLGFRCCADLTSEERLSLRP